MPQISLILPTGEAIELLYAVPAGGIISNYINGIRRGWINEDSHAAHEWFRLLPKMIESLQGGLENAGISFDTIVCPKSSRPDSEPLHAAVLARWPAVRDLSKNFTRKFLTKAADAGNVDDMIEELVYARDGSEPSIRSLLILDESISTGKTAAAVLHHLRTAGMPADAKVTIAVFCKMK